jgi:flagellar motor switch protein FliN/FliY
MSDDALLRLGDSTSQAVDGVLQAFAAGAVRRGAIRVHDAVASAAEGVALPVVAADVSYVDGVTGGNVFLLPVEGARRLAAAMMGGDPDAVDASGELSELELSAVGEAMNQMMSAAAIATGGVLGQEVEISPPQINVLHSAEEAVAMLGATGASHVLTVDFTVTGAPARLVQLVPNAFVVRMNRALDEITTEYTSAPLGDSLRAVPVRVWAELGRARMPAGASLGVANGSVIELDREVEEPIDLYVDGMRFACGRLLVGDDGSLQLKIDTVVGLRESPLAADYADVDVPQDQDPDVPAAPEPAPEPETETTEV